MSNWVYILTGFAVVLFIRVLPMTLIRKPIENRFIRSFLYYVPYVTLSVMTFPAILQATSSPLAGVVSLLLGVYAAYKGADLLKVAILCCIVCLVLLLV